MATTRDDGIELYSLNNEGVELVLFDQDENDENQIGGVRTSVKHRYGRVQEKHYNAELRRLEEAHGHFNSASTSKDDATLLVIKVIPKTDKQKRWFEDFTIEFAVEPPQDNSNADSPYISAYEPAGDGTLYYQEQVTNVTKTKSISGTLTGKPPAGAELSLTGSDETQRAYEERQLLKMSAGSSGTFPGKDEQVWFTLEPAVKKDGIGDSFAVALIVKRAPGTSFFLKVTLTAKVTHRASDAFKWVSDAPGKVQGWVKGKDQENVLRLGPFGPADSSVQTNPQGVELKNLEAASDKILKMLGYVHLPEKAAKKLFLQAEAVDHQTDTTTGTESQSIQDHINPLEDSVPPKPTFLAASLPVRGVPSPIPAQEEPEILDSATSLRTRPNPNSKQPPSPGIPLSILNARAVRHRLIAKQYQYLAQLHLEEAAETEELVNLGYMI